MTCFRERTRVKIGVFYGKKHALINSRERTRIWLHTRHPSGAIEPCRMCGRDIEKVEEIFYENKYNDLEYGDF